MQNETDISEFPTMVKQNSKKHSKKKKIKRRPTDQDDFIMKRSRTETPSKEEVKIPFGTAREDRTRKESPSKII